MQVALHEARRLETPRARRRAATGPFWSGLIQGSRLLILAELTMTPRRESFDHLVGAGKQHWGNLYAESACGLKINNEFELCRLQDRKF